MPTYDFLCRSCGETFEARTAIDEAPPCPACGEPGAERQISGFAGPFKVGLRGVAARKSDANRAAREERRRERQAQRAEQRRQGPDSN